MKTDTFNLPFIKQSTMKIKAIILTSLVLSLIACGNSDAEKKKKEADALRLADSLIIAIENSMAEGAQPQKEISKAIQLEDESMKAGKRIDTLRYFYFGMTKEQVDKQCKKLIASNDLGDLGNGHVYYKFATKDFIICNGIDFYYDNNNKLFRQVDIVLEKMIEPKNNTKAN